MRSLLLLSLYPFRNTSIRLFYIEGYENCVFIFIFCFIDSIDGVWSNFYERNGLAFAEERNQQIFLVWHSTELSTGLSGMLGLWTLGKIWNWGVLTSSTVNSFAVTFGNSSCFLKLSIALLRIPECLEVGFTFSFW